MRNLNKARLYQREYRRKNRAKVLRRKIEDNRKRKTGFTPEMFAHQIKAQGGVCAICAVPFAAKKKGKRKYRPHADHDHQNRTPRGVLCSLCNTALGGFRDSEFILQAAIRYIRLWRAQ